MNADGFKQLSTTIMFTICTDNVPYICQCLEVLKTNGIDHKTAGILSFNPSLKVYVQLPRQRNVFKRKGRP